MASEHAPIDISKDAALLRLAEEVYRTKRPRVLRRANEDIAVIAPLQKTARRPARKTATGTEKYTTVASLAGAAGTLPTPARWEGVRESAREEHLEAKYGPSA
jgi:hypothetical protein